MMDLDDIPAVEQKSNKEILVDIFKSAIPNTITMFAFFIMEVISATFNGHMPEEEMIAGASLGSMYCAIVGLSISVGLNSALTTLIS